MRKLYFSLFLIGMIGIATSAAFAQPYIQVQKLVASDGSSSNSFLSTVAVSGNYAVIGGISNAYVFEKTTSGWHEIQKLEALSVPGSVPDFGSRVSIDGDQIFVEESAELPAEDFTRIGAVHVFEKTDTGWTQVQVITPPDSDPFGRFGWSIDVRGNQAVIGGFRTVYFYEKTGMGWELVKEFPSPSPNSTDGDSFGFAVSLSGNYAIVGDADDTEEEARGAAYIYEKTDTGWTQVQKITASDSSTTHAFGHSVSMDGDYAVVGGNIYTGDGKAYIFQKTEAGWVEVDKLEGSGNDNFGYFVHLSGDQIVVSDNFNKVAYLFKRSGTSWMETDKLTPDDHATSFGESVFLADQEIFVSTRLDTETVPGAGAAYVFAKKEVSNEVAITGFSLIDANTNQILQSIKEGDKIDLSNYKNQNFNILVHTKPETVGSVALTLQAFGGEPKEEKLLIERTENKVPYAFFGDKKGDARNWQPEINHYAIVATPYTESKQQGLSGKPLAVNFRIIQSRPAPATQVADFSAFRDDRLIIPEVFLVNAENNQPLQRIQPGDVINLESYANKNFNMVLTTGSESIGSMVIDMHLDGLVHMRRVENKFPYAAFGDTDMGFRYWEPETGKYTLHATAFSGKFGEGAMLFNEEVNFRIVDEPVAPTPEIAEEALLTLYPNPATTQVNARTKTDKAYTLSIFDSYGKVVYRKAGAGKVEENIQINQQPGLYIVVLEAGDKRQTQRLILK